MKKIFTSLLCTAVFAVSFGQWTQTSPHGNKIRETKATSYYSLDIDQMRASLAGAQETGKNAKSVEIKLPTLDGKIERFKVYSFPVVVKSLADRYQLGSYVGVGIDDPSKYLRFSVAPNDFQSMIIQDGKYQFIEPQTADKTVYAVHAKTVNTGDKAFLCNMNENALTKKQVEDLLENGKSFANNPSDFSKSSDQKYRTMRLAMSVTGEYTAYFGGTVAGALTAINATITRVNGVYEKELALHLNLQDFPAVIYTNAATDPYSAATAGANGAWNTELMNTLHNVVGDTNFDIGHLFGASGGGGNAGCIGCVCNNTLSTGGGANDSYKGSGFTSPADAIPQGDNFDIDYVAHEMGHQLGGNHSFSFQLEGTGQNVEPGSGTTIMGYAGITGATDVQAHSDPYFHINNIIQIQNNLTTKTCDVETPIANTPPVITPMPSVTIPKGTAFVLTASATDAQGDPLTYSWEQVDNATTASTIGNLGTLTNGPDFRVWNPTTSPTRYFPKLSTVLAGSLKSTTDWEAVSTVARTTNFRVAVRDNNPTTTAQQTQHALQTVVVGADGPFAVTGVKVYNDVPTYPITWNVVNTATAPYNAANVKIDYTTDNGATWTVLTNSTPNDGTESFNFNAIPKNTVLKVRVSAIGNVFYAIAPLTVIASPTAVPNCPTLISPANNSTTVSYTTATLSWTAPTTGDLPDSYNVYLDQNPNPTTLVGNTTGTSYSVSGLAPSTQYYWKVVPKNIIGSSTGCGASTFTTIVANYCSALATSTSASFEKINSVVFADISKTSTSTAGYENFTAITGNLTKGTPYIFTATATKSFATDQLTVWIDLNNDKDFDDAGEQVFISTKKKSPWTGTITIPTTAITGTTRMRIRLNNTSSGSNATPCGTSTYGQVEDYTLNIGVLAVDDSVKNQGIQLYPNPATDVLNISKVSNKATYAIYNMAGQAVSKGNVIENKVSVSKLEKGVYIISITNDGEVVKAKFIKK